MSDKRTGRGTMFFKNDDRYDGYWLNDLPHGEGRMIYANGDIYEGMWSFGKKSGYGKMTRFVSSAYKNLKTLQSRRNGDHFEGHWVNDKREGKGSYFFSAKNKVFVGEWVDDMPKAGVYSEVDDPDNPKIEKYGLNFVLFYNISLDSKNSLTLTLFQMFLLSSLIIPLMYSKEPSRMLSKVACSTVLASFQLTNCSTKKSSGSFSKSSKPLKLLVKKKQSMLQISKLFFRT